MLAFLHVANTSLSPPPLSLRPIFVSAEFDVSSLHVRVLYSSGVVPQSVIRSVSQTAIRMNAVSVDLQHDKDTNALPYSP